MYQET